MATEPPITITDCLHAFALAEPFVSEEIKDPREAMGAQQGVALTILDWALHECCHNLARIDAAEVQGREPVPFGPEEPKRC